MENSVPTVRDAVENDVPEMVSLLNQIIYTGGTTAREVSLSEQEFIRHFLRSEKHIQCLVSNHEDGKAIGFQFVGTRDDLPDGWCDISTFVSINSVGRGVGKALFKETKLRLITAGFETINATIRADNSSGLAYYSGQGFQDYSVNRAVPLKDGTPVDRVSKRYDLKH